MHGTGYEAYRRTDAYDVFERSACAFCSTETRNKNRFMKNTNEPKKLWNGATYGTPYERSHTHLIERLDGESLAVVATATGRSIIGLLNDNGHNTLVGLGRAQ